MSPHLLVVGVACYDYIATFERYPEPDTKCTAISSTCGGGGNGANMSWGLATMGNAVVFVTLLYNDAHGSFIATELTSAGVDLSHCVRLDGRTAVSNIVLDQAGTRTIFHIPAEPKEPTADQVAACSAFGEEAPRLLVLDGRHADLAVGLARRYLAADPNLAVLLDCERENRPGLPALLDVASHPVCTEEFLLRLHPSSPADALASLAAFLRGRGGGRTRAVVVTRGAKGGYLAVRSPPGTPDAASRPSLASVPGWAVSAFDAAPAPAGRSIVDSTGAGDSLQAALAHCLVRGIPVEEAVVVAADVAVRNCCAPGTRNYPSPAQIEDMVTEHCRGKRQPSPPS